MLYGILVSVAELHINIKQIKTLLKNRKQFNDE